jgi:hypothetical protein
MKENYEDIISLPHYEPKKHPRMSKYNRAAQFAPFAALTGYKEEVKETTRLTDKKVEDYENLRSTLNSQLQIIDNHIKEKPEVTITYFVADKKKSGGSYVKITGNVKKIDSVDKVVIMIDKKKIPMKDILSISADILKSEGDYNEF